MDRTLIESFARCLAACLFLLAVSTVRGEDGPDVEGVQREWPRLDPIEAPSGAEIEEAIDDGIGYLLADQNENGSWGSATRTKGLNIYAPIPGAHHAFRAAVTAMCISALIETGSDREDVVGALEPAEEWLMENLPRVRRATGDAMYNVWTHCYAIQALVRMDQRVPDDKTRRERIRELIELQFDMLTRYASVDGGWGYYDFRYETKQPSSSSISFVNAAVLVAFREAADAGFEPPQKVVDKAIAATLRQRLPDFSYLYGEYLKDSPRMGVNRPGGSLGRSQACNVALRLWGDEKVTDDVLRRWLDRLFARNGWLDIGRKRPIPHEAWMQVAGYFYYFGHYYAAYCIEQLPEEDRPEYQAHLARLMLDRQEKDGSWWDYPLYDYHKPYGTSFVLMTLARCR
ncbi:MAG: hypothetical protein DWQ34_02425 [Planctomycetota bacterium]|nr:MAG: hypothetical protein DWQ34_02425 [Planctomycetota bacterium]REK21213.1 MAG: hypothetical protein DWQ41_22665 [Planctomycetota bacterium]REK29622.1 MAG: hypothetical protein DWQ45_22700 [Planctomycetota bacterium]